MRRICRLGTFACGAAILLAGCQSPDAPAPAIAPVQPRAAMAQAVTDQAAADEAIRLQYRRVRAKELVEEAKALRLKHQFNEAGRKMDEASKLLEGLPEEE